MAQEGSEASVNWWPEMISTSHSDNQIWNQVLLGVGNNSGREIQGEKFMELLSCTKKLEGSTWPSAELFSPPSNSPKYSSSNLNGLLLDGQSERLVTSDLSDLVTNWSIAPPNPHQFGTSFSSFNDIHNSTGLASIWPSISVPRHLSDLISFSPLNKSAALMANQPCDRVGSDSSENNGRNTKGSGRGSGTIAATSSEGKKKRSEQYSSETLFKKPKHETSTASSLKLQVPKVKVGDKITALQQIVSPFGKTDTASVLLEAINYINFLQEQIQLLSDPYLKSTNKEHSSRGSTERKELSESKLGLKSRGLCLVPISCTPQACRDNTGPDYWTPPYRGCLFR